MIAIVQFNRFQQHFAGPDCSFIKNKIEPMKLISFFVGQFKIFEYILEYI